MKKAFLGVALIPCLSIAAPPSSIKNSLSPFQPVSITMNSGKIKIVTDERRVTDKIYSAIINNGICMPLWLGDTSSLDGVKEVRVLNKFSKQGYIFGGGKEVCQKMGKLKQKESEVFLMGHTSIH